MIFPEFDPVIFNIGPLPLRWYALAYVLGIVLGWWYAARLIKQESVWSPRRPPVTALQLDDLVLWVTVGIILGGRLGYALFYRPDLYGQLFTGNGWGERLELFQLWTGGMSFHGGFLGVVIGLTIYGLKHRLNLLSLGDLIAPVVPIGLFFGRMANFINGELWGRATDVPWAIRFCNDRILSTYGFCPAGDIPRHPSQLYEAGLEGLALFLVLTLAIWKFRMLKRPGFIMGLFLAGYGTARALLENTRQPDAGLESLPLGLTMGMYLSIPMVLVGLWLIVRALKTPVVAAPAEPEAGARPA
ncbi:prolipoprotein diacylglyceryl transferase [Brevundimonas variabilis]|uniref:Phosphatidylglycerol--prolipoprotein diacylglyceryl transferase n=1 Tax=Brevundimonas variabilis TaxID=74312 RepID=A0A7W9CJL1_9CAUL|nr:phosphatidylglycerol:prolipoprotein diacylglycerol transferase [Brevundimonas variabilis]